MSLLVWLPLNGDLHNQGCGNVTITANAGEAYYNNGKIGKAFNLNKRITFNCPQLNGLSTFSITFWGQPMTSSTLTTNWQDLLGFTDVSTSGTTGQFRFETCYNYAAGNGVHWHDNATNAIVNGSWTGPAEKGTWHHYAVIVKKNEYIKTYCDGILQSTITTNLYGGYLNGQFWIGETNNIEGMINDVRVYNHCLSAAEVHEIAQGLVLHYKLDDPYIEIPTFIESTINTTAYNGATGKYGYNETANLAKTTGFFQGKNCIKISTITEGQSARPYSYFSNLFTSNGTNAPAYKALSFDYFTTCPTTTWLNIYKLGSGEGTATWKTTNSTGVHSGVYTNSSDAILVTPNEWNHVEVILHGTTNANAEWGYCINGPTHTSNLNYYFLFANIQLEENDHTTGYGANMHKPIITDSSGYGHNGEIINEIIISSDTPRYNNSINFMDNTGGIEISTMPMQIFNNGNTIAFWIKPSGENGQRSIYCSSYSGNSYSIEKTTGNKLRIWWSGSPDVYASSLTILDNEWQHIAVVKTENKSSIILYKNGEYIETLTNTFDDKNWSGTYRLGRDNRTDNTSYIGQMSDFRIYCTPLLDTDIKMLYNTSMRIDNLGGTHAYAFEEKASHWINRGQSAFGANSANAVKTTISSSEVEFFMPANASNYGGLLYPESNRSVSNYDIALNWGDTLVFEFEAKCDKAVTVYYDYNEWPINNPSGWSGNDNTNNRTTSTIALSPNVWTRCCFRSTNLNETKNPNHYPLYDYSYVGIYAHTEDCTIRFRNPIAYILQNGSMQIKKSGIVSHNDFTESDIKNYASINDKSKNIYATNFIEK